MQGLIKRRCFLMAEETHRRLKETARIQRLTLGGTIRRLLDAYQGKQFFEARKRREND